MREKNIISIDEEFANEQGAKNILVGNKKIHFDKKNILGLQIVWSFGHWQP